MNTTGNNNTATGFDALTSNPTGDDTLNDHIWQQVSTLYNGVTYATAKVAAPSQSRQLLFEDRIAYQRAIEEVYWRHRIWPKERPDSKPSLDAMMSQAQLEKKVEDYLRNSQALEDCRRTSLTLCFHFVPFAISNLERLSRCWR